MSRPAKTLITLALLILLVAIFSDHKNIFSSLITSLKSDPKNEVKTEMFSVYENIIEPNTDLSPTWKLYLNDTYNFQISYPSNWYVYEFDDSMTPVIAFYPHAITNTEQNKPSFRRNATAVTIYPHGFPGEGLGTKTIASKVSRVPSSTEQYDFVLSDEQTTFATQVNFRDSGVDNWGDFGFITARLLVNNFGLHCITKENQNECDVFEGDAYVYKGIIADGENRKVIQEMLESFRFTN